MQHGEKGGMKKAALETILDGFESAVKDALARLRVHCQHVQTCVVCGASCGKQHEITCVIWPLIMARKRLHDAEEVEERAA